MRTIITYFQQHPYQASALLTWLVNNVLTAIVAAFPSPTAQSKPFYVWWFKFSNTVMGNSIRALNAHVENSPNFDDAVKAKVENGVPAQGSTTTTVVATQVKKP